MTGKKEEAKEKESAQEAEEVLTEEQRIERLEKKVGVGKVLMLGIALLLIIILSVSITAFSLFMAKDSGKSKQEAITTLQTDLAALKQQLADQDTKLTELALALPEIKGQLTNSSNTMLQNVLIEQEQSNQLFLAALRSGAYDLAHMVPGSRTWLEIYSEQIDNTIARSKAREESLKKLKASQPLPADDPFFGDKF